MILEYRRPRRGGRRVGRTLGARRKRSPEAHGTSPGRAHVPTRARGTGCIGAPRRHTRSAWEVPTDRLRDVLAVLEGLGLFVDQTTRGSDVSEVAG